MALHEFLGHFVSAAIAADRRYVRTQDAADIHAGIDVWEQLQATEELVGAAPEALVDSYLAVSMLYARRHEVSGRSSDLSLALRYLATARKHVVPGSFADLQAQMSKAAYLMQRYRADWQPEDLDGAIDGWTELLDSVAGALAAANLGRALLERFELAGDRADLEEGRRLLGLASAEMPRDHPARRDVELALRSAE